MSSSGKSLLRPPNTKTDDLPSITELRDDSNFNDGPPVREAARKANERIKETRELLYGEGGTVQDINDADSDRLVDEEAYSSISSCSFSCMARLMALGSAGNVKGDYGENLKDLRLKLK